MQLKTSTAEVLEVGGDKAKYDAQVKNILSNKPILAWILKYTTEEFQNYDIETIINCIEGEIDVQKISVNPGKSNRSKITGINTEDKVPDEGEITYDIRFHVLTPEKERIKLIINIEAQKEYYTVYDIVTRGIFYCSRMISSQLDTEFEIPYYDDIKKVYSIWICMDVPKHVENTITEYRMMPKNISTVLSDTLVPEQKESVLSDKYGIAVTREMQEEMRLMCNLSDRIEAKGIEKGVQKGRLETLFELVHDGILSVGDAAARVSMPESAFSTEMESYSFSHQ